MLLSMLLSAQLHAASLAGVTLPDTASLGGQTLTLNGIGLREKYYLDIYVAGLYVPAPSKDANTLINAETPKRIVMQFVYSELPRERMIASFEEDFGKMTGVEPYRDAINQLESWLPASLKKGDQLSFDYEPGKGTSLLHNGRTLGTIPGSGFMKLIYTIYLGPNPPTAALKAALLGG